MTQTVPGCTGLEFTAGLCQQAKSFFPSPCLVVKGNSWGIHAPNALSSCRVAFSHAATAVAITNLSGEIVLLAEQCGFEARQVRSTRAFFACA